MILHPKPYRIKKPAPTFLNIILLSATILPSYSAYISHHILLLSPSRNFRTRIIPSLVHRDRPQSNILRNNYQTA